MTSYEQWSLIITGAGIFVGICVLIVYALQLKAMTDSVVATKVAANAAMNSSETAAKSLTIAERAYLAADDAQAFFAAHDLPPTITLTVTNTGTTPGNSVQITYKVQVLDTIPETPELNNALTIYPEVIFGGRYRHLAHQFVLSPDALESLQSRSSTLHFWGQVEYLDVFGERHRTGFGFSLELDPEPMFTVIKAPGYNYAD